MPIDAPLPDSAALAPAPTVPTASQRGRADDVVDATGTAPGSAMATRLIAWFGEVARDLPWRRPDRTPWGVLVSEIMLQQTPVARVEPVWLAWLERWPTPADLAAASTADVLRAWGRLGYPRRALRLQECARAIVERHDGGVPDDEEALRALPGVGSYTAAAVRAFAFGRRAIVVDTNVRRVLARILGGVALPAPSYTVAERSLAESLTPDDDATAALWAAASMELGAVVCTARGPRCGVCPVRDLCRWYAAGHPPDEHAGRRRTQAWHGTDRQVRGRIMAVLRGSTGRVNRCMLTDVGTEAQVDHCLAGLIEDGLIEQDSSGRYHLPED